MFKILFVFILSINVFGKSDPRQDYIKLLETGAPFLCSAYCPNGGTTITATCVKTHDAPNDKDNCRDNNLGPETKQCAEQKRNEAFYAFAESCSALGGDYECNPMGSDKINWAPLNPGCHSTACGCCKCLDQDGNILNLKKNLTEENYTNME